jgi:hypothetical protein
MAPGHPHLAVLALLLCACKAFNPAPDNGTFADCCRGLGTCVPAGLVPGPLGARLAGDTCGPALLCAPKAFAENPNAAALACRAPGNLEGRCLPGCLPQIAAMSAQLARASCQDGELCAPCYDPRSGEDSGACHIGGDPGPGEAPAVFAPCCAGQGRCVPRDALLQQSVAADDLARLAADSCAKPEALCVPEAWFDAPRPPPEVCRALGNLEGRCLPTCLPDIAKQADKLQQRTCKSGERCAPCYDPRSGEDSQACRTADDQPHEPPRTFGACCAGHARCVPREVLQDAVSAPDLQRLGADTCSEADALCVPEAWLDSNRPAPAACRAPGDLEGRCLSTCLPDVAKQRDSLQRVSCMDSELCVPCYDPRSGQDSGACRIGADMPVAAPRTFDACCAGRAHCVPRDVLLLSATDSDLAVLGMGSCSGPNTYCVPDAWLATPRPVPPACRAPGDLEGRCLSTCLAQVAERADTLRQASCAAGELCVPCYDPRSGADSRACRSGSDQPAEPARKFADCCGSAAVALGTCVPVELLTSEQQSSLPVDSCTAYASRCAPTQLLAAGPATSVPSCSTSSLLAPAQAGVCLGDCFIGASAALLSRASCGSAEHCIACTLLPPNLGLDCK